MSKKKNRKQKNNKNIAPETKAITAEETAEKTSDTLTETSEDTQEDTPETRETISEEVFFDTKAENAEEKEVSQIVENAISEDKPEKTDSSVDDSEGEAEKTAEPAGTQYSEEAREEFERAQKAQAKKTREARKEDPEKTKEDEEKRLARRKRRIRNQVIAYLTVFLFFAVIIGGGVFAVKHFIIDKGLFNKKEPTEISQTDATDVNTDVNVDDTGLDDIETGDVTLPDDGETVPDDGQETDVPADTDETVTEVNTEDEEAARLDEYIDGVIAGMTIEQKVAGIIMTSPEALTKVNLATVAGDGTRTALENYPVGGICYAPKNVTSHDQFKAMITGTTGMVSVPTFFAIAEDGGKNNSPIAKVDFYEYALSPDQIVETNDVANALNAGITIGSALSELGLNLDLAPVADLSSEARETLDGRTYGSSAMDTIGYVSQMEEGLETGGVTACLKYFPGQGYATTDPENGRTVIDKSEEDYRSGDLLVYQSCIENGSKMIMVSNAVITAFDDTQPATMSERIVTDLLRNELGFDGVILSGNLSDVSVTDYYGPDEAAILSLKAGCDMIMNPVEFETAYTGIIKAVGDGVISEERINDALKRIYRIKYAGSV